MNRILFLFLLLAAGCTININPGPTPSPTPTPIPLPSPSSSNNPNLGVNIEGLADWQRSMMFSDVVKTARVPWGSADNPWDGKGPAVDASGWPTGDFGAILMSNLNEHMLGTYHLVFKGQADVWCTATIKNKVYDAASDTTSADVVISSTAADLNMGFRNTGGKVRDLHFYRPSVDPKNPTTFSAEFLRMVKPFKVLRLMDYQMTNQSTIKEWIDRPKVSDPLWAQVSGGPLEPMIELANLEDKDLWINIPDQAADDYVLQLAKLLKATLKPTQNVYLEYSNEVWNWQFPQATRNLETAKAEVAKGGSNLNNDGETNFYYYPWRRVARRAIEIGNIFKGVYGADAINKNVRVILASQVGWFYMLKHQLDWVNKTYGAPKQFYYGVAGAPYFGAAQGVSDKADLTKDVLLSSMEGEIKKYFDSYSKYYSMAQAYGLKNISYEGGWDSGQNAVNKDARIAASLDPRAGDLVENYLSNWFGCGGDLMMYFGMSGMDSQWGQWGLTNDAMNLTHPKYLAALRVLSANPASFECGANRMHSTLGAISNGTGLAGEYFKEQALTTSLKKRVDPLINFIWSGEWGAGLPDPLITQNSFGVRWTGKIVPRYSEEYTFKTASIDGVRLTVNGVSLIDDWTAHPMKDNSGKITLEAGKQYDLKLEYFGSNGGAIRLLWSSTSQPEGLVPASSLFPN